MDVSLLEQLSKAKLSCVLLLSLIHILKSYISYISYNFTILPIVLSLITFDLFCTSPWLSFVTTAQILSKD